MRTTSASLKLEWLNPTADDADAAWTPNAVTPSPAVRTAHISADSMYLALTMHPPHIRSTDDRQNRARQSEVQSNAFDNLFATTLRVRKRKRWIEWRPLAALWVVRTSLPGRMFLSLGVRGAGRVWKCVA